ncbi:MAG: phosphatase PAP2 family protein [Terriglobia bacterium]|jgi:undecaprenyl-diphosphatase
MTITRTMIELMAHQDQRLMRRIQRWRPPRWVRVWMLFATRAGNGWMWYAWGLAVLTFGDSNRFIAILSSAFSVAVGAAVFLALKQRIGRKRPCELGRVCWVSLLPPDRFSFPSGHTITAFAVVTPLIYFYPSLIVVLLFCALSVAASRIVLGMHFLSDVLAGCAIGCGLGYISLLTFS